MRKELIVKHKFPSLKIGKGPERRNLVNPSETLMIVRKREIGKSKPSPGPVMSILVCLSLTRGIEEYISS